MIRSAHTDTFARDNLPPRELWPEFPGLAELGYPDRLNATQELLGKWIERGHGNHRCLISDSESWSYAKLAAQVNRIANVLTRDIGMQPGNRVLLRTPNTPLLVAAFLAVTAAGGVVVPTMPLLRARELRHAVDKAQVSLALCDARLTEELHKAAPNLRTVTFGELEAMMRQSGYDHFTPCDTAADDVCLIAFTSGTTGEPRGTMHFHRDLLAVCDSYGRHVLRAQESDICIGSPPLAFTFGLGGLVLFPLRAGAASVLLEKTKPEDLLAAIETQRATICFTAPTAYRAMLPKLAAHDVSSLRTCVSAGETLPKTTFDAWREATGLRIMDGIGSTEMLHIFIGSRAEDAVPGATGKVVPGYEAKVIDDDGNEMAPGVPGRLAVRGPTGCRYLADARQAQYVQRGWNVTGDTYVMDEQRVFWYRARSDDMIISAGYNIAGPEVESALLTHPAVAECGVVGKPDADRGQIVQAYVILRAGFAADGGMAQALQDHVKAEIAPYKYPRVVEFVAALPRTESGKLKRYALRRMAGTHDA